MTFKDLDKVFNLYGIITPNITIRVNTNNGRVSALINDVEICKSYFNVNEIKSLLWNADCIETNYVYFRSAEKNDKWQTKQALDYVAEGGENTYASYSDDAILNRFDTIFIYSMRFNN